MENNVVDIEMEYFKRKNKEAYDKLVNKEFESVKELLRKHKKVDVAMATRQSLKKYQKQKLMN